MTSVDPFSSLYGALFVRPVISQYHLSIAVALSSSLVLPLQAWVSTFFPVESGLAKAWRTLLTGNLPTGTSHNDKHFIPSLLAESGIQP